MLYVIFLDLLKAFETINLDLLVTKLRACGFLKSLNKFKF